MAGNEKRNAVIYINGVEVNNTLSSIESHARKLRAEMQHLDRSTDEFQRSLNSLRDTNKILAGHRQQVAGVNKAWEDVKMQLKGFGATMLAYLGGNAILSGFSNLIQKNVELSKAQTAVQRTTQLTNEQMKQLNESLGGLNTKTARIELLKLAEEAGKQGKNSVEAVTAFVSDMDKAIIALGGDLGEGVIEQLGKLSTIFDTSSLKIGNAIKAIADSSIASAPYQVDFMMRTAGVANTVAVTADELMGLGATLENLGQSQEVSGTAINQFLLKLTQNTDEFGKIAGFADGELKKLIGEKGTNSGFIAFLEKLRETSTGTDDLVTRLNDLGLDGTRNAAVLLTLANNTGLIAKQQVIAKDAIGETSLVMDSFNKANTDFAANWTKFMKSVGEFFMNNALSQGFINIIGKLADTRTEAQKAADAFTDQKNSVKSLEAQIIPLKDRYIELNSKFVKSKEEQIELKKIITTISTILPGAVTEWDKYGNAIGISTSKINEHIAAEREMLRLKSADAIKSTYTEINTLMAEIDAKAAEIARGGYMVAGKGTKNNAAQYVPLTPEDIKRLQKEIDQAKAKLVEGYITIENTLGQTLNVTDQMNMQLYGVTSSGMNLASAYFKEVGTVTNDAATVVNDATDLIVDDINKVEKAADTTFKKSFSDIANETEDLRQEIFLLLADDATRALAELDSFFEQLINKAEAYGLPTEELFDLWGKKALELETQLKETADAAVTMYDGISSGGSVGRKNKADDADKKRRDTENQTAETIKLREEQEKYNEALFQSGVAAVESAENQQEAIKAVLNSIRQAIKQRIMEALATVIGQALASVPFPFNVALATTAGAAASALFDKLVPQAADGGYFQDVVGRQDGRSYRAKVDQRFMGGYATQPMLVGEAGAEYTVPSYLMRNPYVINMVDQIEGMRKGGNAPSTSSTNIDLSEVISKMDQMIEQMKEGKVVVMPDQTIKEFNKRLRMLEILSLIPFR